jgi:hypothetical protein
MSQEAAEDPAEAAGAPARVPRAPAPAPPGPEPAGDARVDEALAGLGTLGGSPVSGHVAVFEEIHQRLQELLVSADQDEPAPGMPAPPDPASGRPAPQAGPSGPRPGQVPGPGPGPGHEGPPRPGSWA